VDISAKLPLKICVFQFRFPAVFVAEFTKVHMSLTYGLLLAISFKYTRWQVIENFRE
jgi:hypothetical protein